MNNLMKRNNSIRTPFEMLNNFEREFMDLFTRSPLRTESELSPTLGWGFEPACDITETDSHYVMSFDLPGVKEKDIDVNVSDRTLHISGERKSEWESERGRRSEKIYGHFERSFTLPETIDPDKIEANFEDGVLTVALPKAEGRQARKVEVQKGRGGFINKLMGRSEREKTSKSH